jgi:hypothetical protein
MVMGPLLTMIAHPVPGILPDRSVRPVDRLKLITQQAFRYLLDKLTAISSLPPQ